VTPAEVGDLRHGLYRLHWKSGGASLASVGSLNNGDRWFACTNWTASSVQAGVASTQWELVAVAELLPVKEPAKPMNVLQRALIALESTPDPSAKDLALVAEVRTLEENLRLSGYFSRQASANENALREPGPVGAGPDDFGGSDEGSHYCAQWRAGAQDAADLGILSEEHL
jgi:hypothetical protein